MRSFGVTRLDRVQLANVVHVELRHGTVCWQSVAELAQGMHPAAAKGQLPALPHGGVLVHLRPIADERIRHRLQERNDSVGTAAFREQEDDVWRLGARTSTRSLCHRIQSTCRRPRTPPLRCSKLPNSVKLCGTCCALRRRTGTPACVPSSVAQAPGECRGRWRSSRDTSCRGAARRRAASGPWFERCGRSRSPRPGSPLPSAAPARESAA